MWVIAHLGAGNQKEDPKLHHLLRHSVIPKYTSTTTVVSCMKALEESGLVNCGIGRFNETGDAMLFNGALGAVTGTTTRFPFQVAKVLYEQPMVKSNLIVPRMVFGDEWAIQHGLYEAFSTEKEDDPLQAHDTVGCIAMNEQVCIGTSSGGPIFKCSSRVGSSALYGSGAYYLNANNVKVSITTTGNGEQILISQFAVHFCYTVAHSTDLHASIDQLLKDFCHEQATRPLLGFIALVQSSHDYMIYGHTTPSFYVGYYHTKAKTIYSKNLGAYTFGMIPIPSYR